MGLLGLRVTVADELESLQPWFRGQQTPRFKLAVEKNIHMDDATLESPDKLTPKLLPCFNI